MALENQKQMETNMRQYYEILRSRQSQIIGIIKETSELLSRINSLSQTSDPGKNTDQIVEKNLGDGMQLAFGMINALANILDEQMKALNIWERLLLDEKQPTELQSNIDCGFQDYYEITTN
jgi:hypothetical protein